MKAGTSNRILVKSKRQNWAWISAVVFIVALSVIGMKVYMNAKNQNQVQVQSLGTYDDPEVAFKETQKALLILSTHLNNGIESAQYIQEYDKTKKLIFKEQ